MGRYAFFTTGFEYKFKFGVQDSSDILSFGGIKDGGETCFVGWSEKDIPIIQECLVDLEKHLDLLPIKLSTYDGNLQGTYALCHDLYKLYETHQPEETVAHYILGYLILHQLLYANDLGAHYEY